MGEFKVIQVDGKESREQEILLAFELSKTNTEPRALIISFPALTNQMELLDYHWGAVLVDFRSKQHIPVDVIQPMITKPPKVNHRIIIISQEQISNYYEANIFNTLNKWMNFTTNTNTRLALSSQVLYPPNYSHRENRTPIAVFRCPLTTEQRKLYTTVLHKFQKNTAPTTWRTISTKDSILEFQKVCNEIPGANAKAANGKFQVLSALLPHLRSEKILLLLQFRDFRLLDQLSRIFKELGMNFHSFLQIDVPPTKFTVQLVLPRNNVIVMTMEDVPSGINEVMFDSVILFDVCMQNNQWLDKLNQILCVSSKLSIFQFISCNTIEEFAILFTKGMEYVLVEAPNSLELSNLDTVNYEKEVKLQTQSILDARKILKDSSQSLGKLLKDGDKIVSLRSLEDLSTVAASWEYLLKTGQVSSVDDQRSIVGHWNSFIHNPLHMSILAAYEKSQPILGVILSQTQQKLTVQMPCEYF